MTETIHVYGTTWCPDCTRVKRVLEYFGTDYEWTNIERDAAARTYVQQVNGGLKSVPTNVFADGSVLIEPSDIELRQKLDRLF